jgi:hypothetical protein
MTGCVSTKIVPVDSKSLVSLQGATTAASQREKPSFSAMTAGKAMFGMIGAAAMISQGNSIVKENGIEDPAAYIGEKLLADLASANSLQVVKRKDVVASGTDVAKLSKQYADVGLLVDVQTINWSFAYFPTDWTHYRVIYSAKFRLIDTKRAKIIADGFCARIPDDSPEAPTGDQLLENNAARLKQELQTAADHCVNEFRTKVLLMQGAQKA